MPELLLVHHGTVAEQDALGLEARDLGADLRLGTAEHRGQGGGPEGGILTEELDQRVHGPSKAQQAPGLKA